jgi:hypothetical protein
VSGGKKLMRLDISDALTDPGLYLDFSTSHAQTVRDSGLRLSGGNYNLGWLITKSLTIFSASFE